MFGPIPKSPAIITIARPGIPFDGNLGGLPHSPLPPLITMNSAQFSNQAINIDHNKQHIDHGIKNKGNASGTLWIHPNVKNDSK